MYKRLTLVALILLLIIPPILADPPPSEYHVWLPYVAYQKVKPQPYNIQAIDAVLQFDDMPSTYTIIREEPITEIPDIEISNAYLIIWGDIFIPSPVLVVNIVIVFPNVDDAHNYINRVTNNCKKSGGIITIPQIGDEATMCYFSNDTIDIYTTTYRFGNIVSAIVVNDTFALALRYTNASLSRIKQSCEN